MQIQRGDQIYNIKDGMGKELTSTILAGNDQMVHDYMSRDVNWNKLPTLIASQEVIDFIESFSYKWTSGDRALYMINNAYFKLKLKENEPKSAASY